MEFIKNLWKKHFKLGNCQNRVKNAKKIPLSFWDSQKIDEKCRYCTYKNWCSNYEHPTSDCEYAFEEGHFPIR